MCVLVCAVIKINIIREVLEFINKEGEKEREEEKECVEQTFKNRHIYVQNIFPPIALTKIIKNDNLVSDAIRLNYSSLIALVYLNKS